MAQNTVVRQEETMGRRLASVRVLRGLSQEEAAKRAGVTQPYLSRLENDAAPAPPLHTVTRLATLYDVSLDYLVRGDAAAA